MALWIAGGVSLDIWGACREQCQMPPCCRMSTHWTVGRLNDVRGSGDSSIHHLWLSSISQSSVVSAFSSVKLTAAHRKMISRLLGGLPGRRHWGSGCSTTKTTMESLPGDWNTYITLFLFITENSWLFLIFFFQKKNYYNFKLFCQ